jgi:hypothetical protein
MLKCTNRKGEDMTFAEKASTTTERRVWPRAVAAGAALAGALALNACGSIPPDKNPVAVRPADASACAMYPTDVHGGWSTAAISKRHLPSKYTLGAAGKIGVVDYYPIDRSQAQRADPQDYNKVISVSGKVAETGSEYTIEVPIGTGKDGLPKNAGLGDVLTQDEPSVAVIVHVVADGQLTQFAETLGCVTDNGNTANIQLLTN